MMIAYTSRDLCAIVFLAVVLLLVLWQLIGGLRKGVIYVPGKREIFRVVRADEPLSFWGACAFYCFIVLGLNMAACGVLRDVFWPGPREPADMTACAIDAVTVEVSWLPPERRDPPPEYRVYRSTKPGGIDQSDYELIATVTAQPYKDRSVMPATRYFYRVAADYAGQPPAMSNEDSTITDASDDL